MGALVQGDTRNATVSVGASAHSRTQLFAYEFLQQSVAGLLHQRTHLDWQHEASPGSAPDEGQKVRIDDIRMRRAHPMR